MLLKGKLIGFKRTVSQKGNDCFFGYVVGKPENDDKLVGSSATQVNAFGSDAVTLYNKCVDKKLLDKDVSINGYFNNNQFYGCTID